MHKVEGLWFGSGSGGSLVHIFVGRVVQTGSQSGLIPTWF